MSQTIQIQRINTIKRHLQGDRLYDILHKQKDRFFHWTDIEYDLREKESKELVFRVFTDCFRVYQDYSLAYEVYTYYQKHWKGNIDELEIFGEFLVKDGRFREAMNVYEAILQYPDEETSEKQIQITNAQKEIVSFSSMSRKQRAVCHYLKVLIANATALTDNHWLIIDGKPYIQIEKLLKDHFIYHHLYHYLLGTVYFRFCMFEKAIMNLDKAIRMNPFFTPYQQTYQTLVYRMDSLLQENPSLEYLRPKQLKDSTPGQLVQSLTKEIPQRKVPGHQYVMAD